MTDRIGRVPHAEPATIVAAIYARKSTEQTTVSDEQKSVARQLEHATAYAERKGWTVAPEFIFVDDGVSGAEFAARPGFVRLMNSICVLSSFPSNASRRQSRMMGISSM